MLVCREKIFWGGALNPKLFRGFASTENGVLTLTTKTWRYNFISLVDREIEHFFFNDIFGFGGKGYWVF